MIERKFRDDLESYEREGVKRLKQAIPELAALPDLAVVSLYRTYSDDTHSASWLAFTNDDGTMLDFERWLFADVRARHELKLVEPLVPDQPLMQHGKKDVPGKHPIVATAIIDEAARLRAKARGFLHAPAPAPPGTDKTETFAKLWTEAWRQECAMVADRLGDAAKILEDAASGISPTHDLLNWRR